jgi:2-dehydro-3-deoxyphosphogluconate aldolase/(4S)-4-hydroxy-2-oxoglutarate aldolase
MALNTVLIRLRKLRIIPVIRTSTPEIAETVIEWLTDAGFRTFEITLTIPDAFDLIT